MRRGRAAAALVAGLLMAGAIAAAVVFIRSAGDGDRVAAPATGTLVFQRGVDLWVAALDGSTPPRAITSGSLDSRYAGYVRRPDGGIDLYYTMQLIEAAGEKEAEVGLYRVDLEGGEPEELLRFAARSNARFVGADVSQDGGLVVYGDGDRFGLLDLFSGETEELVQARRVVDEAGTLIHTDLLVSPQWSPTGDVIHSGKFAGPDTIVSVLIEPFSNPARVTDIGYPTYLATWRPDGALLCLWSSVGLGEGGLSIYDVETGVAIDVLATGPLPTPTLFQMPSVGGCAWYDDGRLAITYTTHYENPAQVFVLDRNLTIVEQSEFIEDFSAVIDWLPDGSGVVLARSNREGERLPPAIFQPGVGIAELSIEADFVLAVIP